MSKYSINVARRERANFYVHFCRVDAGEDEQHAREVWSAMLNRFGAPQFKVEMTRWDTLGKTLEWQGPALTPREET